MRLLPYGETALLVECERDDEVGAVFALLQTALEGVELVPAARTVLVRVAAPDGLAETWTTVADLLAEPLPPTPIPSPGQTVTIPVHYDGEDLAEVAALTGLTADEIIAAHTGQPWRVAFGGFAPGFAYLAGGDRRLVVPRRASPRTVVPAGAVGLAGEYSGIYPRSSPGGWQLIGSTDALLWDEARTPPALLRPGWWVRFEEVR